MPRPLPVSDAKIKQRVTQLLNNCGLRPPSRVTVTCARGEVTLTGVLHNEYQRQPAMRRAIGRGCTQRCRSVTKGGTHRSLQDDRASTQPVQLS